MFVGVILVIAGNSEHVVAIYWSLFGSVKICNLYRSVQIAAEKCFIILTLSQAAACDGTLYQMMPEGNETLPAPGVLPI